jgi:uncharacterized phage protein (TIGR01671 family)
MSRTIKFRGWQLSEKKMHYEGHFHFDKDGVVGLEQGVSWIGRLDIVPMQFTDLFDKSGKEIWEGDIANITHIQPDGGSGKDIRYTERGVMRWIPEEAKFVFDVKDSLFNDDMTCLDIEVLGNIYENPELLK